MPSLSQRTLFLLLQNPCKTLISFSSSDFNFKNPFRFSTSKTQNPPPRSPFIVNYLANSCGFSPEEAISASRNLAHIKSPEKPDTVLSFFRNDCGLNDTQIRQLISKRPKFLAADVEKTLVPKVRILQELGILGTLLSKTIVSNPMLLAKSVKNHLIPTINLLRTILGTNENIAKVLKRSRWDSYIQKDMLPNISTLQKLGIPNQRIMMLLLRIPGLFMRNPAYLEGIIGHVEELGLTPQDRMFIHAISIIGSMSKAKLEAKFELFKSLGWSVADIRSTFVRYPNIMGYSEERIQKTMHYYTTELGCDRSYIILQPRMLNYSLEKRIIPRCKVLRILKSNGLLKKGHSLATIMGLTEKKFMGEYVDPYKENAPDVYEACMGNM